MLMSDESVYLLDSIGVELTGQVGQPFDLDDAVVHGWSEGARDEVRHHDRQLYPAKQNTTTSFKNSNK